MTNFKLTLLVASMFLLIGCGGAEERKEIYLEKAKQSLAAGDLDKARIELKNVLQIDPKDAQAYFQLAGIYDTKKEYRKALKFYIKAEELDPGNSEYHAKIGTYYLILAGDIDKAIEKRDIVLSKDATNVDGLLLKATILLKQNDVAAAKKIAQDIFLRQPGNVKNTIFLSVIYLADMQYEDSINVLKAGIKENPESSLLTNLLANAYLKAGKKDLAENEYKGILDRNPEIYANHAQLALFYKEIGSMDMAEKVLRKAIENDAGDVDRKVTLIEFVEQIKGNRSAIEELKQLISDNKDMGDLRLRLAKLYDVENKSDDAEKVLKSAILDFSEDSVGIQSRVHLANLYMQNGNFDSAMTVIDEALKISPNDSDANLMKAKLLIKNKSYEESVIFLRIVIKDAPENIEAYTLLSAIHSFNGKNERENEILVQAYDNNRANKNALIELAQYQVKMKRYNEAEKIIDASLGIDEDDYEALTIKCAILNFKKKFTESKFYSEKLIKLYANKSNGYLMIVPSLLFESNKERALSLLKQGYIKTNKDIKILKVLVSMQLSMNNFSEAEDQIKLEINDKGDEVALYMLLSDVYSAAGKTGQLEKTLGKVIDLRPEFIETYLMLSKLYILSDRNDMAKDLLKKGLSINIDDFKLTLALANLYESDKEYEKAINEYERMLRTNNVIIMNNLAALLSEYRTDAVSLKRAKELADKLKRVNKDIVLDTAGWVYYKVGDYAEAVNVLKTVVEKSSNVAVFNYHLGMALYKTGDIVSAKIYLTNSLANDDDFPGKADAEALLKSLQ